MLNDGKGDSVNHPSKSVFSENTVAFALRVNCQVLMVLEKCIYHFGGTGKTQIEKWCQFPEDTDFKIDATESTMQMYNYYPEIFPVQKDLFGVC